MKTALLKSCLLGAGILISANAQSEIHYPTFEGPLMGQKAPGKIAEPFAPGVISTNKWEVEGVFSPDMNEFYYTRKIDKVITVVGFRKSNNVNRSLGVLSGTAKWQVGIRPAGQPQMLTLWTNQIKSGHGPPDQP